MKLKFSKVDINTSLNCWGGWSYHTPCNILMASTVCFEMVTTIGALSALIKRIREMSDRNSCGFSITQREKGWKVVHQLIAMHPEYFQTVTTKSNHGNYKVMWVIFKTNGRKF